MPESPVDSSESPAETMIATVESLSHDARGVARVNGKVVFIEGALAGEQVRLRLLRRYRRYDLAASIEVIVPSPERRDPPCPHFGVCGGCSMQHLASAAQIRAKQAVLAEQLKRVGRVEPKNWLAPIAGPEWGYRRRARLGVRWVRQKDRVTIGFRERRRSYIANLDGCLVLDPVVSGWIPDLRRLVAGLSQPNRIPQIEVAVGDNARALVFRHLAPLTAQDKENLATFGQRHDVQIYLQPGTPDTVTALWPAEPIPLGYSLADGTTLRFRPTDFIQVNAGINNKMIERALHLLDPQPGDNVLDLFSGLGNFTLPLARRAGRVLGIEGDARLVEGARRNAVANGLAHIEFRVANLGAESHGLAPWHDFAFNKLLLDPPRYGAMEAVKSLREPLPEKIVYVSCYPATLARDSEYLVHVLGYRLSAAGVMDMFPHTNHAESMALFDRP